MPAADQLSGVASHRDQEERSAGDGMGTMLMRAESQVQQPGVSGARAPVRLNIWILPGGATLPDVRESKM